MSKLLDAVYAGRRDEVAAILAGHPTLDVFEAAAVGDVGRVRALMDADPRVLEETR